MTIGFVNDVAAPVGQSVLYPGGFITMQAVPLTFSNGTDTGSGVGLRLVQRSSGTLFNGACTAATFVTIFTNPPPSVTDTTVPNDTCNIYQYEEFDNLGNASISVNGGLIAKVDASAPEVGSVQLKNNGTTAGRIDAGDQIVIGFIDEGMKVSSFCSGWANDNANQILNTDNQVTVTVTDGAGAANDTLSVRIAGATAASASARSISALVRTSTEAR